MSGRLARQAWHQTGELGRDTPVGVRHCTVFAQLVEKGRDSEAVGVRVRVRNRGAAGGAEEDGERIVGWDKLAQRATAHQPSQEPASPAKGPGMDRAAPEAL